MSASGVYPLRSSRLIYVVVMVEIFETHFACRQTSTLKGKKNQRFVFLMRQNVRRWPHNLRPPGVISLKQGEAMLTLTPSLNYSRRCHRYEDITTNWI